MTSRLSDLVPFVLDMVYIVRNCFNASCETRIKNGTICLKLHGKVSTADIVIITCWIAGLNNIQMYYAGNVLIYSML